MNICVISDLHIGRGFQMDTFLWKIRDFIEILKYVKK